MNTPPPMDTPNRAEFAERHFQDRRGTPWKPREYQRNSLNSTAARKLHCCGRDVGKTTEIEIMALWFLNHCPGEEMLIATQTENHLDPLMQRIARRIQSIPAFRARLVESRRSPSWFFRFDNGAMLWGRIAGPRGTNFQGMHVDWQIIDEAQELTDTAWNEILQAMNGEGHRWVYGVPNGLRNNFYRMATQPLVEFHHWPSSINPEFSAAKDAELLHLYGGQDSPGYTHRVLGLHGAPAHAVFNLDDYLACVDADAEFQHLHGRGNMPLRVPGGSGAAALLQPQPGTYFLGCDLGFARDPSEFVVYRNHPPHFSNVARIHLENVNYARQVQLIQELDAHYRFEGIGIDAGNNGRAVAHQLMELGPEWCEKIHAYEFGGTVELPELPDGSIPRRRTKELMTELLARRMAERTIRFPRLPDRESQYAAHTYEIGQHGHIVYQKGNDHLIDADRCAILRHHLHTAGPRRAARPPLPLTILTF